MAKKRKPPLGAKSKKPALPAKSAPTPRRTAQAKPKTAPAVPRTKQAANGYIVTGEPPARIVPANIGGAGQACGSFDAAKDLAIDRLLECIESCERHLTLLKQSASYDQYAQRLSAP